MESYEPGNDASPSVELDLEDLVSQLHALKNLYGLLQKKGARPPSPDHSTTSHLLDEQSRHLLKKLLDGATREALQSQAKIISYKPETPKTPAKSNPSLFSANALRNELQEAEEFRQCTPSTAPCENPTVNVQCPPESFPAVSESGVSPNPCPVCDPFPANRPRSKDPPIRNIGSSHSHSRSRSRSRRLDPSSSRHRHMVDRRSGSKSTSKSSEPSKKPIHRSESLTKGSSSLVRADNRSSRAPSSVKGGEVLALVPAQKRPRVGPLELAGLDANRTCRAGHVDRELIYQKKTSSRPGAVRLPNLARTSKGDTGPSRVKNLLQRRMGCSKDDRGSKTIILARDRTSEIKNHANKLDSQQWNRSPRLPLRRLQARRYSAISTTETSRSDSLSNSPMRSASQTGLNPMTRRYRRTRSRKAALPKPIIGRGAVHKPEKALLQQVPSNRASLVPIHKSPARQRKASKEFGRLRRFKNKLSLIFHHHHHHHLHDQSEDDDGGNRKKRRERLFRKYLMKAVRHSSTGSCGKEEHGKETACRQHHGYLRAFVEGILHLLWRSPGRRTGNANRRQRMGKAATASRKGSKKLHWWHWFRRRGGLWLGGRRRPRLLLGFNRSRRRTIAGKC